MGQQLTQLTAQTGRPPFATRVYFLPSTRFPVGVAEAEALGRDVADTLAAEVGLPVESQGLMVSSGGLLLLPPPADTRYSAGQSHLTTVEAVYVADVADHLTIEAGEPLTAEHPPATGILDVWMHADLAAEIGARVGEQFQVALNRRQPARTLVIRGLWRNKMPGDRFWFSDPDSTMRTSLLVTARWLYRSGRTDDGRPQRLCQLAHHPG